MRKHDPVFSFEKGTVRLIDGKLFRPADESIDRWLAAVTPSYRILGNCFDILYQLINDRFVHLHCVDCTRERKSSKSGKPLFIWQTSNIEAQLVTSEQALNYFIEFNFAIPECLSHLTKGSSVLEDAGQSPQEESMKDFFISYNSKDKQWAEWIAWTLEAAGYETVIQAWDFRAGGDFVMEMQKAATGTRKTIAVLSENYLRAEYTQPEWGNAFARDPQGIQRTLVPVRVAKCKPDGLLATRIYIDLVGLSADEAREKLIDSLKDRGKPTTSPVFPGTPAEPSAEPKTEHPQTSFPGKASSAVEVWQEKLEFLRTQEPLAVGADQKFALKKQIEEAQLKIRELSGNP